ncbi:MAG: DUF3822 family protein [Bacteroidales bacterium]|jgi:hypothetical protein|nr:DUF3822 family protein [Bacteroidales bacterium]
MSFSLVQYIKTEDSFLPDEMRLSICLRANGFSFSVIDHSFRLKAVGEFEVDLSQGITSVMRSIKECFASLDIRNLKFEKIKIISLTDKQVWIPYKLYDKTQDKNYIQTVCNVLSSETILSTTIEAIDAVSVFAIPLSHYSGLKVAMPTSKYCSQQEILTRYLFDVSSFATNTFLLHKRGNTFDMLIFKGSNFVFSNSFACANAMDMIYYLLFALSRLEIDVEDINLVITGDQYSNEEFDTLCQYVRNVSFANPLENVKVGFEFDGVDLQQYFLLLA